MSSSRCALLSVLLFLAFTSTPVLAQNNQASQEPQEQKARKIRQEPNKAFTDWLNNDVSLIITPDERRAFEKLQTDDEREQFIKIFWDKRDPDPDTEENEYRDQYYERIAYANEHFSSGIPGWKSDRGRIYIKFGKPDEIESHAAGGQYLRQSYEGGGSTTTYPFERWFYRDIPSVGSGVEIEFVDQTGSGEYRMARNLDEKDALLHIPGAGPTIAELVDPSSRAVRIAGAGGFGNVNYLREQDSPFAMQNLMIGLAKAPEINSNRLDQIITHTPRVDEDPLNFDIRVDFFRQSDERVMTALTIQTENRDLAFRDNGGLLTATLNIFGRIKTITERRVGDFEDSVVTTATPTELTEAKERKSVYGKAVALLPGTYRVDVIVRDVTSGATGIRQLGFTVPKYDPGKVETSTIVLASKLESMPNQPAVGRFVIGQTKVIPNVSGSYHRGQPVGVYLQVYNAGIDQTTLRPSVDAEYVLLKDGREISKQVEDWRGLSDSGQRLTLARLIDTRELAPGEYKIEIRIRDHVTQQTLSPAAKFTVAQ